MQVGAGRYWKGELMANDEHRLRKSPEPPFCWQNKAVLRKILESFDGENAVASAIGTYVALTEIASDEQAETFKTTHLYISSKSGWSASTVKKRVQELKEIGIIDIYTPKLRGPCTYWLLSVGQSSSNDGQPVTNDSQPLPSVSQRQEKLPLATSEESKKNVYEESKEEGGADAPTPHKKTRFVPPALNEVKTKAKELGLPDIEAEEFFNYNETAGWKVSGRPMVDWVAALRNKKIRYEKWKNDKAAHVTTAEHEKGF